MPRSHGVGHHKLLHGPVLCSVPSICVPLADSKDTKLPSTLPQPAQFNWPHKAMRGRGAGLLAHQCRHAGQGRAYHAGPASCFSLSCTSFSAICKSIYITTAQLARRHESTVLQSTTAQNRASATCPSRQPREQHPGADPVLTPS